MTSPGIHLARSSFSAARAHEAHDKKRIAERQRKTSFLVNENTVFFMMYSPLSAVINHTFFM
jgi:hypothetical protein